MDPEKSLEFLNKCCDELKAMSQEEFDKRCIEVGLDKNEEDDITNKFLKDINLNNKYRCDDWSYIKNIKDQSIDLICIDPPYEIYYDSWDSKILNWKNIFKEFNRLLKPNGNLIIFQGWSNVNETLQIGKEYFILQNWIIWDRIKGRGAKYNFTSTREDILWFTKTNEYTFNKIYSNIKKKTGGMGVKNGQENRSLSNVWYDISPIVPWSKEKVEHPTQKPVALIERIIKIFSNENDLILDCFCGSGTTGVACKNLNRNFICIDNNIAYIDIAITRSLV